MPLAVRDIGSGPAVVLLHGQPGAAGFWYPVVERLRRSCRLIVPDRPGYGDSGERARGFEGNAELVLELLDQRGIASATVVGHSWAGGIGLLLADRHPERVDGLVLISSVGPRSAVVPFDRVLAWPAVGSLLSFVGFGVVRRIFPPEWLGAPLHDVEGAPQRRGRLSGREWRSFVIEQRAMIAAMDELDAMLERISRPVTVMLGERDRLVPPRSSRELAARIAGAQLVAVPGVGHLLPLRRPDAAADAIARRAGVAQG